MNQMDGLGLEGLPDSARVWIYVADRDLNELEENRVREILESFCQSWQSHGRRVRSAAGVIEGRFAFIAGCVDEGEVSGCGIDKSVRTLDHAASELALEWLPGLFVHYRDHRGVIRSVPRKEFRRLARNGEVNADTKVFDPSIETLGQLRRGELERSAVESWHSRVFHIEQPA